MDLKNKIIELNNGEKYIVADSVSHLNRTFLLAGKVLDGEELEDLEMFELIDNKIEKVLDEELIKDIPQVFAMYIGE